MLEPEVEQHYEQGPPERDRLVRSGKGRLEFERTLAVLERELGAGAHVLDIGGAAGVYAAPLARRGHRVELIDPVGLHVEQARERAAGQPDAPFTAELGDARQIDRPDGCADAVLLLGPLYHLPEPADRAKAVAEAHRLTRPGGVALFAGISRFASLLDGLASDHLLDPRFAAIVERDLATGHHENPERVPEYFTDAYFHRADELGREVVAGGFVDVRVVAVEGFAALLPDLAERLDDPGRRSALLDALERVEDELSLLGATFHLLAIGRHAASGDPSTS